MSVVIWGPVVCERPIPFVEIWEKKNRMRQDGRVTCESLRPFVVHLYFSTWHFRCAFGALKCSNARWEMSDAQVNSQVDAQVSQQSLNGCASK